MIIKNLLGGTVIAMVLAGVPALADSDAVILENANPSLVAIETNSSLGSGFILNTRGDFVTNYHLVRDATNISITQATTDNTYKLDDISVVSVDPVRDLAILHIDGFNGFPPGKHPVGRIRSTDETTIVSPSKKRVFALGYPLMADLKSSSFTDGIISGRNSADTLFKNRFPGARKNDYLLLRFTAKTQVGSSGGMLLDSEGRVIAVTTGAVGKGEFMPFAVPIQYVNRLLKKTPVNRQPFREFPWNDQDIPGDRYYENRLYAELKESENTFTVSGHILDKCSQNGIRNARVLFTVEGQSDREYQRLIFTDDVGRYQLNLPVFPIQQWYLTIEHEDYIKMREGPFTELEDIPKKFFMALRKGTMDALIALIPAKIGLNKDKGSTTCMALIYECREIAPNKVVSWAITTPGPVPQWLGIDSSSGYITSGEELPINFTFHKETGLTTPNTATAILGFVPTMSDHKFVERHIVVYADKLPEKQGIWISGRLLTKEQVPPDRPIAISATVDGKPISFYAIAVTGFFQGNVDRSKYQDKDIKLVIENSTYMVDPHDPALVVNKANDWHTVIELKRREQ